VTGPRYVKDSNLLQALRLAVCGALDESGMTRAALARRIGITEKHLSHMLTGQAEGSLEVWSCMLTTFGITVLNVPNFAALGSPTTPEETGTTDD